MTILATRAELQVEVEVTIDAPHARVWNHVMDISKIPAFHPRVDSVDLLSGTAQRAEGVLYRCNITQGRGHGNCVEEVTKVVPMESFTTTVP